ncbi:MAG: MoaD/ThiS family protein [Muribaculaceae bacterium]|nr:MoaD/ThiS family protein [Muribaculaceae bacterium]
MEKKGVGAAVNDIFVRQADWEKRILKEGDRIVFISASYGG